MATLTEPMKTFVGEVRSAVAEETTVTRFLKRTHQALETLLRRPDCLEGLDIDRDAWATWKLYTDPDYGFCVSTAHHKPGHRRGVHDHGELGWAVYGLHQGEGWQDVYERLDDGSSPGKAELRFVERAHQNAGDAVIVPVGWAHSPGSDSPTGSWTVVIRSRDLAEVWRNRYDVEAGTVKRVHSKA